MKIKQSVRHVPLSRIEVNPANIRDDLGDLRELAASITEHGILQPLVVTDDLGDRFLLLGGHRRAAAARLAGLVEVPVVIRHGLAADDVEQLVVMLVENCQRADLNPIEKAEALDRLRDQGLPQTEIAKRTGLSNTSVSRYLGLLRLPPDERERIKAGHQSVKQASAQAIQERQQVRLRAAGRSRGRPKGRKTTPYFSVTHPLAKTVATMCDHRGTPKVGAIGCGQCWETAIRNDALAESSTQEAS